MKKITDTDFIIELLENPPTGIDTTRYNGGWVKKIIGINKEKSNGYSLIGDFIDGGKEAIVRCTIGRLYLDCGIGGSRKNQEKEYTLFTIKDDKILILKKISECKTWAIDLWPEIEKFLGEQPQQKDIAIIIAEKKATETALKELSSDSIITELQNRGYDISSLLKNINLENEIPVYRNIEME